MRCEFLAKLLSGDFVESDRANWRHINYVVGAHCISAIEDTL